MFRGCIPLPHEPLCPELVRAAHVPAWLALVLLLFPRSARRGSVSRCFRRLLLRSVPATRSRDLPSPLRAARLAALSLLPENATLRAKCFLASAPPCACVAHRPLPLALQIHPPGRCSSILFASVLRLPQSLPNRAVLPAILARPARARTPSSPRL